MGLDLYFYLIMYVVILFIISFYISKKQSKESFLIADRNRNSWQVLASKFASTVGAGYFITYTGFSYEYGFGVFAILAGLVFGYLFFAFWAVPKIRRASRNNSFYTLGHFVYSKTQNKTCMILADFFSGLVLLTWLIVGLIGGGKIISDFGLLSYNWAVLFSAFVVLIYLLLAGYKAVVITDILQSFVILFLLFVVTFGIVGNESLIYLFSVDVGKLDIGVLLGFLLFGLFNSFSRSDIFQLSYASKSKKDAIKGFTLAIIPIIFVCFFLLLVGLFMITKVSGLDSGLVFSEALKHFLPTSLLPLAIVLFFSGIMSSADTNIYGISSHLAMYFREEKTLMIRKITIVLLIVISVFAILFPDVVEMSVLAGGFTLLLPLPMIYIFSGGKYPKKFVAGVFMGVIGLFIGILFMGLTPTIALPAFIGSGVGLLFPFKK